MEGYHHKCSLLTQHSACCLKFQLIYIVKLCKRQLHGIALIVFCAQVGGVII